ncbi:RNA-directed DNA polymerase, eukaryota [Tanacetum coccineum]
MESLHLSFSRAVEAGIFKGYKIDPSTTLSHLFYADDAVFIGEWSHSNLKGIMNILRCFSLLSGMSINIQKSHLLGVGIPDNCVAEAAKSIGCLIMKAPFKYLGILVGDNMSSKKAWDETINKMKKRLSRWKLNTLSVGGRLTLLKSVLGSTPIYNMSIFKVPKSVLNYMESLRRNFFNGFQEGDRKIAWVKWSKVLASKKFGGLGVSSFFALNRALLFKWVWRYLSHDNSLWSRIISALHGLNGHVLSAAFNSTWSSIITEVNSLKVKGVDLISHCKIRVGKGTGTSFWKDLWIGDNLLKLSFPRLFALEENKDISVADKMNTSISSSFRRHVRGGVESQQLDQLSLLLDTVILSNMDDRWFWDLNGDGVFQVKDVRSMLDEAFLPKMEVPTRWIKSIPIKVNVFAWKLYLDRLPTRSNLSRRNVSLPSLACPLCDHVLEDSSHLFFGCSVAKDIQKLICRWWNLDVHPYESYEDWLSWFKSIRLEEVLQWCKSKKKQSLIFKVDFEKAFDSVRWDFLDDILRKFGFGNKWCKWIQKCLMSLRGSILINGSPTEEFQFFKGLKQGTKVGGIMTRAEAWKEAIDKVASRLSKWKMRALSIGGRLTLLKSVLGSIPIFYMSIYRFPRVSLRSWKLSDATSLMAMRKVVVKHLGLNGHNFLATIVTGLGVSSLFALNRGLMMKWMWRFYSYDTSLCKAKALEIQGVNVLAKCTKLGYGTNWHCFGRTTGEDKGGVEQSQFDALSSLVSSINLVPMCDRWVWTLESSGIFSVASIRKIIDGNRLATSTSKTRWIKYVPIKANVLAWKVKMDALPTRFNISRRGIVIPSLTCPTCDNGIETSDHLFFKCDMSRHLASKVSSWWSVNYADINSYNEWCSWITTIRLKNKTKAMLEGVFYTMWWYIWNFRNKLLFEDKAPLKATLFDNVNGPCIKPYLKTFYEDTQLDQHRQYLEKLPEVKPYFSSSLYIRSVVSPTAILVRIETEQIEEMIETHVTPIAKEVLKTWLDICAFGKRTAGDSERDFLKKRDHMTKSKTIEIDLDSSLPRLFGQETANRVLEALREVF